MARNNPGRSGMQPIPTFKVNEQQARTAWDAYAAMRRAERDTPKLRENDLWRTLRDDAFGEFRRAFEALL